MFLARIRRLFHGKKGVSEDDFPKEWDRCPNCGETMTREGMAAELMVQRGKPVPDNKRYGRLTMIPLVNVQAAIADIPMLQQRLVTCAKCGLVHCRESRIEDAPIQFMQGGKPFKAG